MVLKKCFNCNKNITKKAPGIECSRCEKCVHATTECANISTKQIAALRATNGLEWSCEECLGGTSKRSSFFIPEDEPETDSEEAKKTITIDVKKLLNDITFEMRKTIKQELESFQTSLEFISDQVSGIEETLRNQNSKIKQLENKNMDLANQNKNLELRICTMEQRQQEFEQQQLATSLEIAGIPKTAEKEDVTLLMKTVASKLDVNADDMLTARRTATRKEKPGSILVEMRSKASRDQWVKSGRDKEPTVGDILGLSTPTGSATDGVYVREALSHHIKTLLYQAGSRLRPSFQYVWCKEGKVLARKNKDTKAIPIYSVKDIDILLE